MNSVSRVLAYILYAALLALGIYLAIPNAVHAFRIAADFWAKF